ncbi:MAG: MmcQ/YjbR family DNA-binding protein [Kibdelosporangium sp.]
MHVESEVAARIRAVCLGLPEAYEEPAWVGVRWRVRSKTFAHVLVIQDGHPPAYAKAAGTDGPACVVTFRSAEPDLSRVGPPFFYGGWGRAVIGLVVDEDTDWDDLTELLIESYRVLAPRKLGKQV